MKPQVKAQGPLTVRDAGRALLQRWPARLAAVAAVLACATPALAQTSEPSAVNSGDTAWLLTSTALVMMMTAPGLALFYGGLVSQRNVLSTLMHSFFILCLISVQWVVIGYSLSFGSDVSGLIGGLDFAFFNGVGADPNGTATIPHIGFAMFQCTFAIITVALITGAVAERIRFTAFLFFSILWATLIYDPLAHWVWGGGWLMTLGALDFAGGTVVHISSGVSALVAACVIGHRKGYPHKTSGPHSVLLTVVGAALLWFGWFGFNAGSALTSGGLAAMAFAVTNTAAGTAALMWACIEWFYRGKPTALGTVTGAVAGLVAITPAAGYVGIPAALIIGMGASVMGYIGINVLKPRFGYDDSLDVFGVHGLCGAWGALATGIFASTAMNPAGADGLLAGNPALLGKQVVAVLACAATAAVGTYIILKVISLFTPLRVTDEDEEKGLDVALHGEVAYAFLLGEEGSEFQPATSGAPSVGAANSLAAEA
jgi:Amt family ammonium transporter